MKVLENSLISTDTVYCGNCGSKLEINQHDLIERPISMFSYGLTYTCPVCKKVRVYNGRKLRNIFYSQNQIY